MTIIIVNTKEKVTLGDNDFYGTFNGIYILAKKISKKDVKQVNDNGYIYYTDYEAIDEELVNNKYWINTAFASENTHNDTAFLNSIRILNK